MEPDRDSEGSNAAPPGAHRKAGDLHPLARGANVGPLRQQVCGDARW